jgi:DNA-binding MarR family transcriptional regulator
VVEEKQMSVAALARAVHLSPSTVVGILDRLEQKGLILRSRDTQDRRVVNTAPTPAGQELVAQAPSPLHQTLTKALEGLNELEQATIELSLERIVDLIDACEIDAAPMLETGSSIADGQAPPATDHDERPAV